MIVSLGEGTSNQQPATSNQQQGKSNEEIDHRRLLLKFEFQQEGYRLMNCSLDVDSRWPKHYSELKSTEWF